MSPSKKQLLVELIDSLRNDTKSWRHIDDGELSIIHISGVKIWHFLGSARVSYPAKIEFGFWGKRLLRRAFNHWQRVEGKAQLTAAENVAVNTALKMLRGQSA